MPFTPAHTAVVLPLLRSKRTSATALVIGSIAPDFEYFFKMSVNGVHGHTWAGLFYFDLPVTFLLAIIFHLVVKQNLIMNLPAFLQRRFQETLETDFISILKAKPMTFILSALFGSATHILWDGFTHGKGMAVNYFSFYDGAFVPFQGVNYPLWYALQQISTFIGLTILTAYILLFMREGDRAVQPRISYWLTLVLLTVAVTTLRFTIHSSDLQLGNLVVSMLSASCIGLICCGFLNFGSSGKDPA
jgi:hypothetical protein